MPVRQRDLFGWATRREQAGPASYLEGYYFSGAGQRRDLRVLQDADVRGMVSAARLAKSPKLRADLDRFQLPLVLDSGAFSGGMTLATYRAILCTFRGRFEFCINLDEIGDPVSSDRNWRALREAGHDVVYTYRAGDERSLFVAASEAAAAGHRIVSVGGLVNYHRLNGWLVIPGFVLKAR